MIILKNAFEIMFKILDGLPKKIKIRSMGYLQSVDTEGVSQTFEDKIPNKN